MSPKLVLVPTSYDDDSDATFETKEIPRTQTERGHFYYLNADARMNLKKYQYHGTDNSILYNYVLSPFAQFCVDKFVPETMAPNVVTLLALVLMTTTYLVCWWYSPTLETNDDFPRWIFLWLAFSLIGYQTLDNMDGKQARRTGSSSPLGLLFDHGCDAVNSIFGSAALICTLGLSIRDDPIPYAASIMAPFVVFYVSTWEEYHVGELILPIVNGPSDGIVINACMHLLTFAKGTSVWHGTEMYDFMRAYLPSFLQTNDTLRNVDVFTFQLILCSMNEICIKIFNVTRKHKGSAANLIPMAVLAVGLCAIGWLDSSVLLESPRTSLHLSTVLFVEMTTSLMLDHMTGQRFKWLRWQQLPLVGIVLALALFNIDTDIMSYWVSAYAWSIGAYLVMKMVLVIQECCDVLNVWCFDIVTPRYSNKAN